MTVVKDAQYEINGMGELILPEATVQELAAITVEQCIAELEDYYEQLTERELRNAKKIPARIVWR